MLHLIAKGQSKKEIGRAKGLLPSTVKSQIGRALTCLRTTNRTDAAIKSRLLALV